MKAARLPKNGLANKMNRSITLAARPDGIPKESDFRLVESPILEPANGEILVQAVYLSVDPYMRGRMNDAKSYAAPHSHR